MRSVPSPNVCLWLVAAAWWQHRSCLGGIRWRRVCRMPRVEVKVPPHSISTGRVGLRFRRRGYRAIRLQDGCIRGWTAAPFLRVASVWPVRVNVSSCPVWMRSAPRSRGLRLPVRVRCPRFWKDAAPWRSLSRRMLCSLDKIWRHCGIRCLFRVSWRGWRQWSIRRAAYSSRLSGMWVPLSWLRWGPSALLVSIPGAPVRSCHDWSRSHPPTSSRQHGVWMWDSRQETSWTLSGLRHRRGLGWQARGKIMPLRPAGRWLRAHGACWAGRCSPRSCGPQT